MTIAHASAVTDGTNAIRHVPRPIRKAQPHRRIGTPALSPSAVMRAATEPHIPVTANPATRAAERVRHVRSGIVTGLTLLGFGTVLGILDHSGLNPCR